MYNEAPSFKGVEVTARACTCIKERLLTGVFILAKVLLNNSHNKQRHPALHMASCRCPHIHHEILLLASNYRHTSGQIYPLSLKWHVCVCVRVSACVSACEFVRVTFLNFVPDCVCIFAANIAQFQNSCEHSQSMCTWRDACCLFHCAHLLRTRLSALQRKHCFFMPLLRKLILDVLCSQGVQRRPGLSDELKNRCFYPGCCMQRLRLLYSMLEDCCISKVHMQETCNWEQSFWSTYLAAGQTGSFGMAVNRHLTVSRHQFPGLSTSDPNFPWS